MGCGISKAVRVAPGRTEHADTPAPVPKAGGTPPVQEDSAGALADPVRNDPHVPGAGAPGSTGRPASVPALSLPEAVAAPEAASDQLEKASAKCGDSATPIQHNGAVSLAWLKASLLPLVDSFMEERYLEDVSVPEFIAAHTCAHAPEEPGCASFWLSSLSHQCTPDHDSHCEARPCTPLQCSAHSLLLLRT